MRTTLTVDDELDEKIREISYREKKPYKVVVNEILRRGLSVVSPMMAKEPFKVRPFSVALPAEYDEMNLRHLAYEMDDEKVLVNQKPEE